MKAQHSYSDTEIAHFVLGLDLGDQGRAIEALLAHDDAAAARALKWEAYLLGIVDALPPLAPPDTVLPRVQQTLGMSVDGTQAAVHGRLQDASGSGWEQTSARSGWFPRLDLRIFRKRRVVLAAIAAALILGAATVVLWAYSHPPIPAVVHEAVQLPPTASPD